MNHERLDAPMKTILKKTLSIFDNIEGYLCKFFLGFFVILLFIQVVMRVVFQSSLTWSEESSRFAFVWFAFLGASYAARLGAHNRVTFQFKFVPKMVGDIFQLIADLVWIGFNTVMTIKSIETIQDMLEFPFYSPALDLPMHYVYMLFPIAFTLMTIRIIQVNVLKFVYKVELKDVDDVSSDLDEMKADMESNA